MDRCGVRARRATGEQSTDRTGTHTHAHTHTRGHTTPYVLRRIDEHPYFSLWLKCNVQFNGLMFLNDCFMCMGLLCIYQPEAHLIRQLALILG